ncbi:sulfite dehydrogenase, partial [Bacteroides ovatus]
MDRRKFLKNTGWSFLGLAASGSLLGSCAAGSKEAKKIMPSASNLKMYWG